MSTNKRYAIAIALALMAGLAMLWLKAGHTPDAAVHVAQAFVDHLQAEQYSRAYQLTLRNNGYVGRTPAEFERIARRQSCKLTRRVGTFPFQSNGNRLRRWLGGRDVDMPKMTVEFEGDCLFGVSLSNVGAGQWRVYSFASHAG